MLNTLRRGERPTLEPRATRLTAFYACPTGATVLAGVPSQCSSVPVAAALALGLHEQHRGAAQLTRGQEGEGPAAVFGVLAAVVP